MDKKYDIYLGRIRALRDGAWGAAGTLGGYVDGEHNLSHDGDSWIFYNSRVSEYGRVYENAQVYGDARVQGNSRIYGDARVYDYSLVEGNASVYGVSHIRGHSVVTGDVGNAIVACKILCPRKCTEHITEIS